MNHNQRKSIVFWIVFLVLVALVAFLIFPKHGVLSAEFKVSEARNIAANLTAASAANFTLRRTNPKKGVAVKNCQDVARVSGKVLPVGFVIGDQVVASGHVIICRLNGPGNSVTQFSIIGIN